MCASVCVITSVVLRDSGSVAQFPFAPFTMALTYPVDLVRVRVNLVPPLETDRLEVVFDLVADTWVGVAPMVAAGQGERWCGGDPSPRPAQPLRLLPYTRSWAS